MTTATPGWEAGSRSRANSASGRGAKSVVAVASRTLPRSAGHRERADLGGVLDVGAGVRLAGAEPPFGVHHRRDA
ncbi:hypothetical protein [Nonomuraea glycinis]|uniref:hypothetical protein n=1 Tax=Nonomuraea glycinis TaxID=2047744 RepID=UPI0033BE365C